MKDALVVSLGGNAFATANQRMTMAGQFEFAARTLSPLFERLGSNQQLLITHGNGPQVGYILTRVEEALGKAYALPLEVCVAESEGEIGYVLQQTIRNLMHGQRPVATLLTQVVVDKDDEAFSLPTKPIGPWLDSKHTAVLEQWRWCMTVKGGAAEWWHHPAPGQLSSLKSSSSCWHWVSL